jgi:hypothetical protein
MHAFDDVGRIPAILSTVGFQDEASMVPPSESVVVLALPDMALLLVGSGDEKIA